MKVILDIKENSRTPFLIEMLKGLNYVKVIKEVKDRNESQMISDFTEAFNDVKLHEEGEKKLKLAKDVINEL